MTTDTINTSERGLERLICTALAGYAWRAAKSTSLANITPS